MDENDDMQITVAPLPENNDDLLDIENDENVVRTTEDDEKELSPKQKKNLATKFLKFLNRNETIDPALKQQILNAANAWAQAAHEEKAPRTRKEKALDFFVPNRNAHLASPILPPNFDRALSKIKKNLPKMKTGLNISNSRLDSLVDEVGLMVWLTSMNLKNNRFADLPKSVFQLSNLQVLNLDNNRLTKLDPALLKMPSLQELSVAHNQIRELPNDSSLENTRIQKFNAAANKITRIPKWLHRLKGTVEVDLTRNRIETQDRITALKNKNLEAGPQIRFSELDDEHGAALAAVNAKPLHEQAQVLIPKEEADAIEAIDTEVNAASFSAYLADLVGTREWKAGEAAAKKGGKNELKEEFAAMFRDMIKHDGLRESVFAHIEKVTGTCRDRAQVGIIDLRIAYHSFNAKTGKYPPGQVFKLGQEIYRIDLLKKISAMTNKILEDSGAAYHDPIEIDLAFPVVLRGKNNLDLTIAPKSMHYGSLLMMGDFTRAKNIVEAAEGGKPETAAELSKTLQQQAFGKVSLHWDDFNEFMGRWEPWQECCKNKCSTEMQKATSKFEDRELDLVATPGGDSDKYIKLLKDYFDNKALTTPEDRQAAWNATLQQIDAADHECMQAIKDYFEECFAKPDNTQQLPDKLVTGSATEYGAWEAALHGTTSQKKEAIALAAMPLAGAYKSGELRLDETAWSKGKDKKVVDTEFTRSTFKQPSKGVENNDASNSKNLPPDETPQINKQKNIEPSISEIKETETKVETPDPITSTDPKQTSTGPLETYTENLWDLYSPFQDFVMGPQQSHIETAKEMVKNKPELANADIEFLGNRSTFAAKYVAEQDGVAVVRITTEKERVILVPLPVSALGGIDRNKAFGVKATLVGDKWEATCAHSLSRSNSVKSDQSETNKNAIGSTSTGKVKL